MSYRKFLALSVLSVAALSGCAESVTQDDVVKGDCGNGSLEATEVCDGDKFAAGKKTCPMGMEGTVVCTNTCSVDTSGCKVINPVATCGNGVLDANEVCDGDKFAAGKGACPAGTTGTVKCSAACTADESACVKQVPVATCGNSKLDGDEACDGDKFAAGKDKCPEGTDGKVVCTSSCTADTSACKAVNPVATCGNGSLDADEVCDGDKFAAGKNSCGEGMTGSVKCSAACTLDTSDCKKPDPVTPVSSCGNSALDDGEECDGDKFAAGKDACPSGMTGVVTCTAKCTVDTGACKLVEAPKTCGNNALDDGEECDGKLFAAGKDACAEGTEGTVSCRDNCTVDTTACKAVTPVDNKCKDEGYESCTAAEEGKTKCDAKGNYALCVDGCWMTEECIKDGLTCDDTKGCVGKCNNNVFSYGVGNTGIEENCTESGKVCDPLKGCVDNKDGIECKGSVLTVKGTKYTYDCKENAKSSIKDRKDMIGCNPVHGCSDIYCNDSALYLCDGASNSCEMVEDCLDYGAACSDESMQCVCSTAKVGCVNDSIAYVCDASGAITDTCSTGYKCVGDKGCQVETSIPGCGNNKFEPELGEQCEDTYGYMSWKGGVEPTCNNYDKYGAYTGKPSCVSCKINTNASCVLKAQSEVISWHFTNLDAIKNYTKGDTCNINGNPSFSTSKYAAQDGKDAWVLGSWGKATTPNFDQKYLEFNVADAAQYDSLSISFSIKRTDNGPKKAKIRFDNGTTKETSEEITVGTKWSDQKISVTHDYMVKNKGAISIRIAGYAQSEETGGSFSIADVVVAGSKK